MPSGRFQASLRLAPDGDPRWTALAGIVLGIVAAGTYWAAAQAWPASVAVVLSLFVTAVLTGIADRGLDSVFFPLIKYNALMALSAASSPLALPENMTLGLIMICGHSTSRALAATLSGSVRPLAPADLGIALGLGVAPAVLLGLPGLIGLAVAIASRLLVAKVDRTNLRRATRRLVLVQNVSEVGFYLGALAAWKYV